MWTHTVVVMVMATTADMTVATQQPIITSIIASPLHITKSNLQENRKTAKEQRSTITNSRQVGEKPFFLIFLRFFFQKAFMGDHDGGSGVDCFLHP